MVIFWKLRWCRPVGPAFQEASRIGAPASAGGHLFALHTFCSLRGLLICAGPKGVWANTYKQESHTGPPAASEHVTSSFRGSVLQHQLDQILLRFPSAQKCSECKNSKSNEWNLWKDWNKIPYEQDPKKMWGVF